MIYVGQNTQETKHDHHPGKAVLFAIQKRYRCWDLQHRFEVVVFRHVICLRDETPDLSFACGNIDADSMIYNVWSSFPFPEVYCIKLLTSVATFLQCRELFYKYVVDCLHSKYVYRIPARLVQDAFPDICGFDVVGIFG